MTQVVNVVMSVPAWAVYLIVGLLAFGESAAFVGLVLPGETALLLGGVLAGTGRISLPAILAVAIVAAVGGDSVGYEIGRWGGRAIRASRAGQFVGEPRWTRAETFVRRRGGWAVFLGRWIGLMRALVPALAGMTRMPYRRFLLFNAMGGIVWSIAVVLGGYFAAASWQRWQGLAGTIGVVLLCLTVAVMLLGKAIPRLRTGWGLVRTWIAGHPEWATSALAIAGVLSVVVTAIADRWADAQLW
ncbi:MAG: rane-associated protein [Actinoplanes sp.]|nr:rane-associated protein [Actinoplanes sp.]